MASSSPREEIPLLRETFLGPYGIRSFCCERLQSFRIIDVIQYQITGIVYSTVRDRSFYTVRSKKLYNVPVDEALDPYVPAHPNTISLEEKVLDTENDTVFEVFPDVPYKLVNMSDYLKTYVTSDPELNSSLVKSGLHAMLVALSHLHRSGRFLGNLAPENLVYGQEQRIFKYAGFMNCSQGYPSYRSPELLLRPYDIPTAASDIWSIGCIFAEFMRQDPIFCPDKELRDIYRLFAGENKALWVKDPDSLPHLEQLEPLDDKLMAMVPSLQGDGLDLLLKMLRLNPFDRISVPDALSHAFFNISEGHKHLEDVLLHPTP